MLTTVGASDSPYVPMIGRPNLSAKRPAALRARRRRPTTPRPSDASAAGATSSDDARLWRIGGGPFHTVTRSRSTQSATPSAYDLVHDHRGALGLGDQQRGEHHHVEDGQRQAVALAQLGSVAPGRHQHCAGHQQVVLRVDRALGTAGRPARVGEAGGRVGVDGHQIRPVVSAVERVPPVVVEHDGRSSGSSPRWVTSDCAVAASHSRSDAPESSRRNAFSGGASAWFTPTQTAPSRIAPWNATMMSTSLGRTARDPIAGPDAELGERAGGPGAGVVQLRGRSIGPVGSRAPRGRAGRPRAASNTLGDGRRHFEQCRHVRMIVHGMPRSAR